MSGLALAEMLRVQRAPESVRSVTTASSPGSFLSRSSQVVTNPRKEIAGSFRTSMGV
jgi:hypothetical protein